jgi:hypothetical protein
MELVRAGKKERASQGKQPRFKGGVSVAEANANLRTFDAAIYKFSRLPRPEREELGVTDADLSALKGAAEALRAKLCPGCAKCVGAYTSWANLCR